MAYKELKCARCDYKWIPRARGGCPVQCPKCKRYDYMSKEPPKKLKKFAKGLVK